MHDIRQNGWTDCDTSRDKLQLAEIEKLLTRNNFEIKETINVNRNICEILDVLRENGDLKETFKN